MSDETERHLEELREQLAALVAYFNAKAEKVDRADDPSGGAESAWYTAALKLEHILLLNAPDSAPAAGPVTGADVHAAIEAAKVDLLVAGWSVRLADAINTEVQKRTPPLDVAGPVGVTQETMDALKVAHISGASTQDLGTTMRIGAQKKLLAAHIARCVAGPVAVRHD